MSSYLLRDFRVDPLGSEFSQSGIFPSYNECHFQRLGSWIDVFKSMPIIDQLDTRTSFNSAHNMATPDVSSAEDSHNLLNGFVKGPFTKSAPTEESACQRDERE